MLRRVVVGVALVAAGIAPAARAAGPAPDREPVADAAGSACVETPRPDPDAPQLVAQRRMFGFHDEELVLCSPGATTPGGSPTHLAARLWVPASCAPAGACPGVLVVHGFAANKELTFSDMRNLVLRGMYVVSYDVRGQGMSGGQAGILGPNEIADEAHVLGWFHREVRPTRTGVYGISQGGGHAFMAAIYNCGSQRAASPSADVSCDDGERWVDAIVPVQGPTMASSDGTCSVFLAGAVAQSRAHPGMTGGSVGCALDGTPLAGAGDAAAAALFPPIDPHAFRLIDKVGWVDVPAYLVTSFNDRLVLPQNTTEFYERLRARGDYAEDLRLLISLDSHGTVGGNFAVLDDVFTWLERQLEGSPEPLRTAPVVFAQAWAGGAFRLEEAWPIPGTTAATWDLASGELRNVPVVASPPENPFLALVAGGLSLRTVGLVPGDHVDFDGPPAQATIELTGLPVVRLRVSSTSGAVQLHVALSEVTAGGDVTELARNRIGTDVAAEPTDLVLPLSVVGHRLAPGSHLRLTLTTSDVLKTVPYATPGTVTIHGGSVDLATVDPDRPVVAGPVPQGAAVTGDPLGALCDGLGLPC